MESNLIQPTRQDREQSAVAILRERQMSGTFVDEPIEGLVPWEWAMDAGAPRAVELLMAIGADLNVKTARSRGFLLHGLDTGMPRWLLIHGLRRLDGAWWRPDDKGRTPFHHPMLDAVVAQALGHRAWSEGVEAQILAAGQDPVKLARWRGHPEVARALAQWLLRH